MPATVVTRHAAQKVVRALLPWAAPASPEGFAFFTTADAIADAFLAKYVSKPFMLGFLARAELETGLSLTPNPDAKRHGLWGWSAERADAILKGCEVDLVAGAMPADQVKAVMWELSSDPQWGFKQIRSASHDAYSAGVAVSTYFSRSDDNDDAERTGLAAVRWEKDWGFTGW